MPEILTCRRILDFMMITGFMIHHMLRVNISIAIVEMASEENFNWDEEQKNDVMGFFFLGYTLLGIPGGRWSEIFGTKIVLGVSMLVSSVLTLLVPLAANLHLYYIIAARLCLGLALSVQWPSLPPMATRWVSPKDSSKFMSHSVASSLGAGATLFACGYLIANLGWASVFYVTGSITFVWALFWFYLVHDTPELHPRIGFKEKEDLMKKIVTRSRDQDKATLPWMKVITSKPVWAIIICNCIQSFTFFFGLNQLPTYMKHVLHFTIEENGILSGSPYFVRYFAALLSSYLADKALKKGTYRTVTVRKFCTITAFLGVCLLFLMQSFWGYDRIVSIIVFNSFLAFMGLCTPGFMANCLDLSPVYCGTILGIANSLSSVTGYISTKIVGIITKESKDFEHWRIMFWILVAVNLISAVSYLVWASGDVQKWNPKQDDNETDKLNNEKC